MQTLIEVRSEINSQGIQTIYQQYRVSTPGGVMLHVIFNLAWQQALKNASTEEIENLNVQRAIFELASEEESKNPSIYSKH